MPTIARPQTFDERSAGIGARAGLLKLDPLTALAAVGLIACSIVALGFTTRNEIAGDPFYYTIRQSIYAVVGIALMFALARIDYSRFRELRVGLYSLLIALNLAVLAIGFGAGGARRWIELPFFQFQPSELGKLLLVLALAGFAIDRARRQTEWQRTARLLLLGFMPALIVFVQPSLGTALVYCAVTFAILFVSGTPWQHFAAMGGLAAAAIAIVLVAAPAVGQPVLQGYQLERLTSFLNPSDDPADSSYQTKQSLTAIGSGGKLGRGDDATQAQQGFLPENHNDFIFAATAERWGFAGAALVLSLYALLIWRALRITTLSTWRRISGTSAQLIG